MKGYIALFSLALSVLVATPAFAAEVGEALEVRSDPPWIGDAGQGLGIGYDNGSWGGSWSQGIRLRIPLLEWISARGGMAFVPRGLMILHPDPDRTDLGTRLDLVGYSPVFMNLVRIYGGGGPQFVWSVGEGADDQVAIGGGGQFGFEFFLTRAVAFYAEIGGQGGDEAISGATVMAGVQVYPF